MSNGGKLPDNALVIEPGEVRPIMVARQEVAKIFIGLAPQTLANLAHEGSGPRYFRRGKICWYSVSEIEAWLMEQPIKTNGGNL